MKGFARLLGDFLLDYVPRRRGLSENTAMSYRDCFVVLLGWLREAHGLEPDAVEISDLGRGRLEEFLAWLGTEHGSKASTVNVRLSALRAFAAYVSVAEPAHLEWARDVKSIAVKRSPSKTVEYLSPEAVGAIIDEAAADARDHAMLSLLYEAGARVSEVCALTVADLSARRPATVKLLGKGPKERVVPISGEVAAICADYVRSRGLRPDDLLFTNRRGKPIGRAGVAWVLSKHAAAAHGRDPMLVPEKVNPHMLSNLNRGEITTPA